MVLQLSSKTLNRGLVQVLDEQRERGRVAILRGFGVILGVGAAGLL